MNTKLNPQNILSFLFLLAMTLWSVYFFPSGSPQISDWILTICAILAFALMPGRFTHILKYPPVALAVGLAAYITLVNVFWMAVLNDRMIGMQSLFYIFNVLSVLTIASLVTLDLEDWKSKLQTGLVLTTLASLAGLVLNFIPGAIRQAGWFNNPNQLGYFALLVLCLAFVIFGRDGWKSWKFWLTVAGAASQTVFSSSISAWVGLAVALIGGLMLIGIRRIPLAVIAASIGVLILLPLLNVTGASEQAVFQITSRMEALDKKTTQISEQRGYTRILEFPEYTVLGAGEGGRYRFGPIHSKLELHSTIGTLLFSYGVPGITLFLTMLWLVLRQKPTSHWVLVSSPLVYSFSHQGLRSTLFWVFLILVALYGRKRD